ncbi:MAG: glutathione S-transferase C-terminal domain-containing protein [Myxococcota bacterium]
MLVNGEWNGAWKPSDDDGDGRFVRKPSSFRDRTLVDEPGRYHLYVALICPWAHRVRLALALKGRAADFPVHVVEPELSEQGWAFAPGADPLHGSTHLWQLYTRTDASYTGRATVPLLWDTRTDRAVNNESADLVAMIDALPSEHPSLRPAEHLPELDALNADLYTRLNNGVYRAGFATTQAAYDHAVTDVFACMEALEARLADGREWLLGDRLTEADLRLFATLIRFETAYYTLFKCSRRRLSEHPALLAHARRFLALPGVAETVSFDHIRRGYFSIRRLNPSGIVPSGPENPLG